MIKENDLFNVTLHHGPVTGCPEPDIDHYMNWYYNFWQL